MIISLLIYLFAHLQIEEIFSGLVAIGTVMMGVFAWQQHQLEKTRLRIEKYDKYLLIYNVLRMIDEEMVVIKRWKNEEEKTIRLQLRQAFFLFENDKNMLEFIKSIIENWNSYILYFNKVSALDGSFNVDPKHREDLMVEMNKFRLKIRSLGLEIDNRFRDYLKIEE